MDDDERQAGPRPCAGACRNTHSSATAGPPRRGNETQGVRFRASQADVPGPARGAATRSGIEPGARALAPRTRNRRQHSADARRRDRRLSPTPGQPGLRLTPLSSGRSPSLPVATAVTRQSRRVSEPPKAVGMNSRKPSNK